MGRGSSRTFLILLYSNASVQGIPNGAEIIYQSYKGAALAQDDPNARNSEFYTLIPWSQASLVNLKYLFLLKFVIPLE